jgi:hypothetical protein
MMWHLSQGAMELPPQQSASWNRLKLLVLLFLSQNYKYYILLMTNIIIITFY